MPNFGKKSMACLETSHPKFIPIAYDVIKVYDHSIIWGHRDEIEQNISFEKGFSSVVWPDSRHNNKPSTAIDVIPWPKQWKASDREFVELIAHYMRAAKKHNTVLEWGGFFILKDGKHFFDAAHIQLAREEYT